MVPSLGTYRRQSIDVSLSHLSLSLSQKKRERERMLTRKNLKKLKHRNYLLPIKMVKTVRFYAMYSLLQ